MNKLLVSLCLLTGAISCHSPANSCIDPTKMNENAVCTMQYDPVCGCNGKTYSNACFADKAGVTSYTKGVCP